MSEACRNIYKTARRAAGFTQEAAAEVLGVSVESVRRFENAVRVPQNDVVERMVVCYNAQHLAYQHLHETNVLFERMMPDIEERALLQTCVHIYNRVRRLEDSGSLARLLAIAEDGVIAEEERLDFADILEQLRALVRSGLELSLLRV